MTDPTNPNDPVNLLSAYEKARLERIMAKVLKSANLPLRQFTHTELGGGKWRDTLGKLEAKIGTGFLHVLLGNRGTGKTQMAVELARPRMADSCYVRAMDFFLEVRRAYAPESREREADVIDRYAAAKLLILDEIQVRSQSDWENRLLIHLLDRRYAALLDTLLIGNLTADEVAKSLGDSIISRLNETGGIILCDWPVIRK